MGIYYIIVLLVLVGVFAALMKYSKEYDKRFGRCSTKFVLGQLIIVFAIIVAIMVTQWYILNG